MSQGKDIASSRERINFDSSWLFHRGDIQFPQTFWGWLKSGICNQGGARSLLDDSSWTPVELPHDFVVEGSFSSEMDPPRSKGEYQEMWEGGDNRLNRGFLPQDVAWYRKHFDLPASDDGRRVYLEFDGAFRASRVFLNDFYVGDHMSGFTGFVYDVTDYLNYGGGNLLSVRVDAREPEGWYYEGGGLYRHVRLVKTAPLHIAPWGVQVKTNFALEQPAEAGLEVKVSVRNRMDSAKDCLVRCRIIDPDGEVTASGECSLSAALWSDSQASVAIRISNPRLWSLETPELYTCVSEVVLDGKVSDSSSATFGIRSAIFDPELGFLLNGEQVKLKGVCCHQDHAGVGSAVPDSVQEFRIRRLKEMGCNAYRTAHHPPSPELMDICDRLGMLVMAENRLISSSEEHVSQLETMIKSMRNHPSIIIWSIGNEEGRVQFGIEGARIARTLRMLAHKLDDRPVTAAIVPYNFHLKAGVQMESFLPMAKELDVMGFNYGDQHWLPYHARFPKQPVVIAEESSIAPTRGCNRRDDAVGHLSHLDAKDGKPFDFERRWELVAKSDFLSGLFIWTGFDYRGEPSPHKWPAVASHFGVMDSCGFPKYNYYYYLSQWRPEPMAYLFPHWTHPGMEGQALDLYAFTNCEEAELFVNGKSIGRKKVEVHHHLEWKGVVYEPGVAELRGYKNGELTASHKVETAGAPFTIKLTPDRRSVPAKGEESVVVDVFVVDEMGRVVPGADNDIRFEVEGPGRLLGVGNGNPSSHESDKAPRRNAFNGCCQAIIRVKGEPGILKLQASSPCLYRASCEIEVR